jgi:D-alanine-D-alanine ligase
MRVLALVHRHLIPPATIEEGTDITSEPWRTEYDVITALTAMGHEVKALGVHDDLGEIRRLATEWKPHICFNLLEGFDDVTIFDQNVISYLELLKLSYTGCNPRGLLLARDKSLSKKLLAYHRIAVPEFEVFRIGRPIRRPKRLNFPLMVKSLTQEASIGISQASVVESDEKLKERVTFIHESIGTAAITEQYIEGRELYVGILGNQALQALPVWELFFTNMPGRQADRDRSREVERQMPRRSTSTAARQGTPDRRPRRSSICASALIERSAPGNTRIDLRCGGGAWVEANPNPVARGRTSRIAEPAGTRVAANHQPGVRWQPESWPRTTKRSGGRQP